MGGYLNLKTGDWIPYNYGIRWFYTWTPTGKVEGREDETLEEQQKRGPIYKLSKPPQLDNNTHRVTNAEDSYIFIIPQKKPDYFNLKITYTVKQGDFEEEVTVYKDLLKVLPGNSDPYFKGGKAYVFHLILSLELDPVNFKVTTDVVDWK